MKKVKIYYKILQWLGQNYLPYSHFFQCIFNLMYSDLFLQIYQFRFKDISDTYKFINLGLKTSQTHVLSNYNLWK